MLAKVSDNPDNITFEQFTQFMVSITEDKTTPDQLRQSFLAISGNKVSVRAQWLLLLMFP